MNCCRALFLLLGVVLFTTANATPLREVPHTTSSASIDGDLDEPLWASALAIGLGVETSPAENTPAPVETTAYLVRNDEFLYIAFVAADPAVDLIRASFRDRDSIMSDDWVGVSLDTFNDERRSYEFYVNPFGAQLDALFNDVLGTTDSSWDTVWNSMGKVHGSGFRVEMEIPFRSLRFANQEDSNTWGISVMRHYPRDVQHRLADAPQERNRDCTLCQYAKFNLHAIPQNTSRGIAITPTLSIAHSDSREPDASGWQSDGTDYEPGLDFAWNINTQNVLAATLNPDFSQVESDALLLDVNTAFALYYPEKRTFFLEGIDYFQTEENTVFTRNVI
ncbi:MAG: carbohydrate binding family 9 domain-containing protein, partial [Xanthomonadales bacterium]|nr:carbohydrate binding family 9 domain-containing protein [Xanthomonadales bacterium]